MATTHTAKSYQVGDRIHIRAQQIWLILIYCAMQKRTVTYGELATMMGYSTTAARTTIKPLAIVAKFCLDHQLPLLNVLVVSATEGVPGHHVILNDGETAAQAQQQVFKFDWFSVRVPTTGQLRTTWESWTD